MYFFRYNLIQWRNIAITKEEIQQSHETAK